MKTLLVVSFAAMITAGVYGVLDFTSDVKNNSLVKYEEELPVVSPLKQSSIRLDGIKLVRVIPDPVATEKKKEVVHNRISDLNIRSFSRAMPPRFRESLLISLAEKDSSVTSIEEKDKLVADSLKKSE